ncbi:hypothetical protein L5G28_04590 [Gordonia sp. HY285]|uniref:hypothetical protein n=1 Tax=Gordonia liuliyuniae TaxID=2911517 RepID=UPI001F3A2FC4|nr:hypothetical protein [Gordonia liuliyuniae]MCF8609438.1 hypothetical protein [Gordonia liuliyuniae]
MITTLKRTIAALTIGAAAVTGVTVAAGDADAKTYGIDNGAYTFKVKNNVFYDHSTSYTKVWVRGNVMSVKVPGRPNTRVRIIATRNGGYFDLGGARSTFVKSKHGRYAGNLYGAGFVVGRNHLIPR